MWFGYVLHATPFCIKVLKVKKTEGGLMFKTLFSRIRVFIQSHIIKPLQCSVIVPLQAPEFANVKNTAHRKMLQRGYQQCIADVRKNIFNAHGMTPVVSENMQKRFGKRVKFF
jgi:hypothetical protein